MHVGIIGGGFSSLITAFIIQYLYKNKDIYITLFESQDLGGQVSTLHHENCYLDLGPSIFYADNLSFLEVIKEIEYQDSFLKIDKSFYKKYTYKDKMYLSLPNTIDTMHKSSVLFFWDSMKFKKAWKSKLNIWPNVSFFEFCKNSFGITISEYLSSAISRGLFYTESEDLELASVVSHYFDVFNSKNSFKEAWDEYNHLIQSIYLTNENTSNNKNEVEPEYYYFKNGMQTFVDKLKEYLESNRVTIEHANIQLLSQESNKEQYYLHTKKTRYGAFDKIFFGVSPSKISSIMRNYNPKLASRVNELEDSSYVSSLILAFNKKEYSESGFGVVYPRKERFPFIKSTYVSNLFPQNFPKNLFVVKLDIIGDISSFEDATIKRLCINPYKKIAKINKDPIWTFTHKGKLPIPKYTKGYYTKQKEIKEQLNNVPFYFNSSYFSGFNLNQILNSNIQLIKSIPW